MDTNHLRIYRQARYCTIGALNNETSNVWFVCHFNGLAERGHYVVAPEGLSRFYLKGYEGRVGATWMTKEDRETDIEDYVVYLDALYDQIFDKIPRENVKVHILGFSQGAATISRWIALGKVELETWILWAGLFPHDLTFEVNREKLLNAKTFLVYGDQDPFRDEEKIRERNQLVAKEGLNYEAIQFEGGHNIPEETLIGLLDRYPGWFH